MGPKDMLWFLNGTKEEDMRQNRGFDDTVRLPQSEERSQPSDSLWVSREDRNSDKSHLPKTLPGYMLIFERESWVFCFYSEDFAVSVVNAGPFAAIWSNAVKCAVNVGK
jgi:hypothetical protein